MDYMKNTKIGIGLGIVSWLLGLLYTWATKAIEGGVQATLNLAPVGEGVKAQIQTGIPTDLASKILGYLNGLPINFMGLITLAIAGIIVVNLGAFVLNLIGSPRALVKTSMRKLASIAVLGTLISGMIVSALAGNVELPIIMTAVTMALYYLIVAFVYGGIARWSKGTQLNQFFIEA